MTDFFYAFGSEEDYVSFRDPTDGSLFIQTVCSILEQHWRRRSLLSMMTMVNSRVADQVMRYEEGGTDYPKGSLFMDVENSTLEELVRLAQDRYSNIGEGDLC